MSLPSFYASIRQRQACRDARFVRPYIRIENIYAWLVERTHGPCVPTCLLSTIHLNNKTNHKGQSSMVIVQSQDPYIRIDNQRVYPFSIDRSTIPSFEEAGEASWEGWNGPEGSGSGPPTNKANVSSCCNNLIQRLKDGLPIPPRIHLPRACLPSRPWPQGGSIRAEA